MPDGVSVGIRADFTAIKARDELTPLVGRCDGFHMTMSQLRSADDEGTFADGVEDHVIFHILEQMPPLGYPAV